MLHAVTGKAKCGPTAIAAVTGLCVNRVQKVIFEYYRGKSRAKVGGLASDEMVVALDRLGLRVTKRIVHSRYPDGRWVGQTHYIGSWRRHRHPKADGDPNRIARYQSLTRDAERDHRNISLKSFFAEAPAGMWIIAANGHWLAYAEGEVVDTGFWFSRVPGAPDPEHGRKVVLEGLRIERKAA